jgi:hypothetical protein
METEVPALKKRFGPEWFERLPVHCLDRQPGRHAAEAMIIHLRSASVHLA